MHTVNGNSNDMLIPIDSSVQVLHVIRYIAHVIIINNDNNLRLESDNASRTTRNCFSSSLFPKRKCFHHHNCFVKFCARKMVYRIGTLYQWMKVFLHTVSYIETTLRLRLWHELKCLNSFSSVKPNTPLILLNYACGYAS